MSADLMKLENEKHVFLIEEERFSGAETLLKAEVEKGRLRKLHMCADDRLVACAEAIVNALILSPRVHSIPRDSGFYRLNINELLQRDFPIPEENLPVLDRAICFSPADSPEPKIWIIEFEPTGLIRLENLVPLQREDWVTTVAQRYLVRGAINGKTYRLQNDEILF